MLIAVLERRANLPLSGFDVYVSTVGGIRVTEPGADLAIALAIASAYRDKAFPVTMAAVGEISLAGEIRPASSGKQRLAEGKRLGFSHVLDSETVHLREALRLAFAGASVERVDVPDF
jgi:DNA repair protein RadA/Sms